MKYEVQPTTKFKKDLKLCKSRGYDIELINQIIKKLANGEKLERKIRITICTETGKDIENVTYYQIGC